MAGEIVLEIIVNTLGDIFIAIGVLAVFLGIFGVFRFSDFRLRLLSSAKIDTVALILVLIGVMLRSGISWFSAKALLILAIVVLANPVVTAQLAARQREDKLGEESRLRVEAHLTDEPLPESDPVPVVEIVDEEPHPPRTGAIKIVLPPDDETAEPFVRLLDDSESPIFPADQSEMMIRPFGKLAMLDDNEVADNEVADNEVTE